MPTSPWFVGLGFVAVLGLAAPASAQTTYRCGSTYQDQPCGASQSSGSVIGGASRTLPSRDTGSVPNIAPASDPGCRQRALAAEKIRWAKEGGRTLEQAQDADPANRVFLQNVYERAGSAAEVRLAVEADCHEEQRRAEEAARLSAAAAALSAGRSGAPPASSSGASSSADGAAHH